MHLGSTLHSLYGGIYRGGYIHVYNCIPKGRHILDYIANGTYFYRYHLLSTTTNCQSNYINIGPTSYVPTAITVQYLCCVLYTKIEIPI